MNLDKKSSFIILGTIAAALAGGFVKENVLKLNRIFTEQYKPEIKEGMDKKEIKQAKKAAKKEKRGANWRNYISGMINGLTAPILSAAGIAGAPVYAAVNSLNRYFIGTREDRGAKGIKSYIDNIKNSPVINAVSAAAIMIPAAKKANFNQIFEKNLNAAIEKIKSAELTSSLSSKSSYQQLEDTIFNNEKISSIMNSEIPVSEKIRLLSGENLFALKFKQITGNFDELSRALKTDCPPTRTIEEAQKYIEGTFGSKYKIEKCLGVGTVAETYLAKDEKGKEICIKILKEGITAEKIMQDKEAFLKMIDSLTDKSDKEKEFLKKNIESIAQGVLQEVDLKNEMNAAQQLVKVTKAAKVVKPIEVKNNIYLMEKADGISLQNLLKETDSGAIEISEAEAKKLIELYQDVLIEQFSKVNADGKIIHGDIHPGNIFIDLDALKAGRKDCFTLIDTGNTIMQTPESAIRFINLTKYIADADVSNITKFVLEGAQLPDGMTYDKAYEEISKELKAAFFDTKTKIGPVTNDSILGITDSIMQKLNIIPSDTQGNLMKSKKSANQSLLEFFKTFVKAMENNLRKKCQNPAEMSKLDMAGEVGKVFKDAASVFGKYLIKANIQERKNLALLPPAERIKIKRSPDAPAKNSLEYLIYQLKQHKAAN